MTISKNFGVNILKIAVLYGGTSKEREVSLSSGKEIMNALQKLGHDVIAIDFNPEQLTNIIEKLKQCDIVFIGLHGKQGEDGTVQGILDLLNIPYVGSGVLASSLAMDKTKAKHIFEHHHIPIAFSKTYQSKEDKEFIKSNILEHFDLPVVIKPNQEGSTLGLSIINHEDELIKGIELAQSHDEFILVEQYIKGKELTVAVLGTIGEEKALPIIEIVPKNDY